MAADDNRLIRHAGIDRLFHWVTAATMTVLLATSLLPIVGIRFAWLEIHWMAGLVLTLVIVLHILRALFRQRLRTIALRGSDFKPAVLAGKYTLAQKLMHLGWTVAVLLAIVTGLVLMVKAGVPFLARNPYLYSLQTWGVLTLLHDLAALLSLFLILVHVYFAILPEKRAYLRAMVSGWITRGELQGTHDLERVNRDD
jgi:cytochrome b subunit of formate dehydrogenase